MAWKWGRSGEEVMGSVAHLEGKRTGRPKGIKSAPPHVRDVRWAYKNLDRPDAKPPSPFAARMRELGREQPERFLTCLLLVDGQGAGGPPGPPETANATASAPAADGTQLNAAGVNGADGAVEPMSPCSEAPGEAPLATEEDRYRLQLPDNDDRRELVGLLHQRLHVSVQGAEYLLDSADRGVSLKKAEALRRKLQQVGVRAEVVKA